MKTALTVVRYFVGILFIFSGLVKANDPLGLSYKMQEFFEVWGWHGLSDYTLVFSVLMIAFEIVAGVAVIISWQMRLFSWLLLLLMIFFTFLTAYAVFSGKIKECGCFGDCIPLTAMQSFWKDVILLILILFLFFNRHRLDSNISVRWALIVLGLTIVASFKLMGYVMTNLPIVDCLPYKKGNNIPEKMQIPEGAVPDSTVITFVYNKAGQEVEFTADQFPDDFDEDIYAFVKRYDKIVRKGNAVPAIRDFALNTMDGTEMTHTLLTTDQYQVYIFLKDELKEGDWAKSFESFNQLLEERNIPAFLVTNMGESAVQQLPEKFFGQYLPLRSDATAIKTAARVNPTIFFIKNGTILDKQAIHNYEKVKEMILKLNAKN